MARPLTEKKYEAIRKAYKKWDDKRYEGVRIYTEQYVLRKLSEKFFLSPGTIENILYSRINR